MDIGSDTYLYAYNGLGDRLAQSVNGDYTSYTLDIVSPLTQVLADGENATLYGLARLGEEQADGWQMHLGDALGSVRQLADGNAAVTMASAYAPFGDVLSTSGDAETVFQYTGEQVDPTGLVYLRARHYAPASGRFLTMDAWEGDPQQPLSYNPWLYVLNNPLLLVDPSGRNPCVLLPPEDQMACLDYWQLGSPPSSDQQGRSPTERPSNITWSPSNSVVPPLLIDAFGNIVEPGTIGAQFKIPILGNTPDEVLEIITGPCGAMVAAAILGLPVTEVYYDAYEAYWYWVDPKSGQRYPVQVSPNYTTSMEIEAIIRSYPTWDAYTVRGITSGLEYQFLRANLSRNRYPIVNTVIQGELGYQYAGLVGHGISPHWILVTGLSSQWQFGEEWQWVRIYNPYNHQIEYYQWSYFLDNWGRGTEWTSSFNPAARNRHLVVAFHNQESSNPYPSP